MQMYSNVGKYMYLCIHKCIHRYSNILRQPVVSVTCSTKKHSQYFNLSDRLFAQTTNCTLWYYC